MSVDDGGGGRQKRLVGGIPKRYRCVVSKQIAVRLPDHLVAFVDDAVAAGSERSRAAVVTRALEREQRRLIASRDAEILAREGPDPEFARLADYAATRQVPLD